MKSKIIFTFFKLTTCWFFVISLSYAAPLPLEKLHLPKGFEVSIYASDLDTPRQLALGDNGVVFVGTMHDKVYALEPNANLTKTSKVDIVAEKLNYPNGVAFHEGSLYVAEIQKISRYDDILQHLQKPLPAKEINTTLPNKEWHGFRYIKFGPDGKLYFGIGMPCNTCLLEDPLFGTISRISLNDPQKIDIYAQGLRNTVGFAWNPEDNTLWFTDNGRDMMGDDLPPEELNHATHAGMNFGFPFFYGDNIPSPHYEGLESSKDMTPPALEMPAHAAPLGMTFYTGKLFPKGYKNTIFVALHGSWNRSKKVGYEVIRVIHQGNDIKGFEPFVSGWLEENQHVWGRPVDVLVMPDGALLVSDDMNGVIYRITPTNKRYKHYEYNTTSNNF